MISKFAIFLFFMIALTAKGMADAPSTQPCRSSDLSGIYVLAQYKEIGHQDRGLFRFRYRFLELTPPATWLEVSINRMPPDPVKMLSNDKGQSNSYSLEPGGQLVVKRGDHIFFTGSCAVSQSDRDGFQVNDLILSGHTGDPGELHELFRRWNGQPYRGAAADFDPAPARTGAPAPAVAAAPSGQGPIALTNGPAAGGAAPVKTDVVTDAAGNVSVVVTNLNRVPLSAFMVVYRNGTNWGGNGVWRNVHVDACLEHHVAWQTNQQWRRGFGNRDTMPGRRMEAYAAAAIFTDGSTWGDRVKLGDLKQYLHVKRGDWQGGC